jgi:hypothetical protein
MSWALPELTRVPSASFVGAARAVDEEETARPARIREELAESFMATIIEVESERI